MSETINPLLSEAIAKQEVLREKEENRERVKELLPDFKDLLATTIADYVPPQETKIEEVTWYSINRPLRDSGRIRPFGEGRKFSTHLEAVIPVDEGKEVTVTLSSSSYPIDSKGESNSDLDYRIDVKDLDYIVLVKNNNVLLQSKQWEHEPFTHHTPIGSRLPTWPAWEREANPDEIESCSSLINSFSQEGVKLTGSTPTRVIKDYSAIQNEVAAINAHLLTGENK